MTTNQFTISTQAFTPRNQFTAQTDSNGQPTGDLNPYNVNVVHELVRRGRTDVAASQYPYEYKHLYNTTNTTGTPADSTKIKMYNNAAQSDMEVDIGAEHAKRYNAQQWGKSSTQQFDHDTVSQSVTDEEKATGQRLAERVDYSQIGQINGSEKKTAYDFFNKDALLTNLWAYRYGLSPEQVLALNHKDREEYSRKLLVDFYNRSNDGVKAQIGNPEQWIESTLKRYAFDADSGDDDKFSKTLAQTGGRVVDGFVDGLSNIYTGAKALVMGYDPDKDEVAEEKSKRLKREAEQTKAEKSLLQRFDSLAADGRWEDLAMLVASNTELQSALLGTSVGSLISDILVTYGLTAAGGAVGGVIGTAGGPGGTVAGGAAGAAAGFSAGVARAALALKKLYQAGKFATVSSVNMVGNLAKEITLDGNVIEPGSELHAALVGYGLLNIPLNLIGGSIEGSIARHLASRIGKEKAAEVAPTLAQKAMSALSRKGYTFTENGVKRSMVRSAGEWLVAQPGKKIVGEGIQETIQGGLGSAVKQGAGPDSSFDSDRIDYETTKREAIKEGIAGAAFGGYHGAVSSAKAKSQRNRDLAVGKQYNDFERFKAEADQSLLDQIDADIAAGKYNIDGTERTDGGAGLPTDPDARKLFEENARQAVLWRHFKGEIHPDVTPDVDPETDSDVNDDPDDPNAPTPPSQEERNELYRKKQYDRWGKATADLSRAGLGDFTADVSPVKDIRGLGADVDSDWNKVSTELSGVAKKLRSNVQRLKDAYERAQRIADGAPTHPNHDLLVEKADQARVAYEQALNDAVGIETAVLRVKNAQDVSAVVRQYGHHLKKNSNAAARLEALSTQATGYDVVRDNASRWNVQERQQVTNIVQEIADRNNVYGFQMDPTNLVDGLTRLTAELKSHGLSTSRSVQQDLERLRILSSMVKYNRPEMLTNWGKADAHVKKVQGQKSSLWGQHKGQYNWAKAQVTNTLNNSNKAFTAQDKQGFRDVLDNLFDSHPVSALDNIIFHMEQSQNNFVSQGTPEDIDTMRQFNGAIHNLRHVRDLIAAGKGETTNIFTPDRYGRAKLGNKLYDKLASRMAFAEVNRYAVDVADIAKIYGIKSLEPTFESDMLGHVDQLRQAIRHQYQLKNNTNAVNQFVIPDVLRQKNGPLQKGREIGDTIDQHLSNIAQRLTDLQQGGQNVPPAPELSTYPYGDLVEALITDQSNAQGGAVKQWVVDQFKKANGGTSPEQKQIDDLFSQLVGSRNSTPLSTPTQPVQQGQPVPVAKSPGEKLLEDLGEQGVGYFRIVQDGPFILSKNSAMNILNTALGHSKDPAKVNEFVGEQLNEVVQNHPDALPDAVQTAIRLHFSDVITTTNLLRGLNGADKAAVINEYTGSLNNKILKHTLESSEDTTVGELAPLLETLVTVSEQDKSTVKRLWAGDIAGTVRNDNTLTINASTALPPNLNLSGVRVADGVIYVNTDHPDIGRLLLNGLTIRAAQVQAVGRIESLEGVTVTGAPDPLSAPRSKLQAYVNGLAKKATPTSDDTTSLAELNRAGIIDQDNKLTTNAISKLTSVALDQATWDPPTTEKQSATQSAIKQAVKKVLGDAASNSVEDAVTGAYKLPLDEKRGVNKSTLGFSDKASPVVDPPAGSKPTQAHKNYNLDDAQPAREKADAEVVKRTLEGMGIDTTGMDFVTGKIDGFAQGTYDSSTGNILVNLEGPRVVDTAVHEVGHRAQEKLNSQRGYTRYISDMNRIGNHPFVQKLLGSSKSKQYQEHDNYKHLDEESGVAGMAYASIVEEIVVDIYAARKTGNWQGFADRYGIKVSGIPADLRGLETPSIIRDFIEAVKNFVRVIIGREEVATTRQILKHLDDLTTADNQVKGFEYTKGRTSADKSFSLDPNNPPNPNKPKDRTTVYTFGYHPDNVFVSDNPTAWWDATGWNFFYVDADGNPVSMSGMSFDDMMTMAQDLDVYIDQRQQDVMMKHKPQEADPFEQFSPPVARMWRRVNRIMRGDDKNIRPLVRNMMGLVQKIAIEQHGADQFLKMAENVLTHVTGTDKEGSITTLVNKYRTKINHQINNPGVAGVMTMFDHKNALFEMLRQAGWSEEFTNNTLYAMRAADVQSELTVRQQEDPKWKGKPIQAGRSFTAFSWDGVDDPDGTKWMAKLTPEQARLAQDLKHLVTELNDSVLRIEKESGRISEEQFNNQIGKFYVPLKNETDPATAFQRRQVGRYTKADDPLTHLLANHEARLRAAEQSMIYQAFMDAVEQYGLTGFATFNSSTLKNKGDGEYAMSADGFLEGNAVTFYRNGKKVRMVITHPAMKAALAKRSKQAQSEYLNTVAKLTGFLGLMRTGTPTFFKTAFLRDMGMSLVNTQGAFRGKEKDFTDADWLALGVKTAARMTKSLPMIAKAKWDNKNGDFTYRVYRSEGGIGNVTAYDIDSVNAALERDVFDSNSVKGKVKGVGRKYLNALRASDDAARYALWINYLEKKNGGAFADEQALVNFLKANPDIANIARDASKNITGNFEQRGMDRSIRSHYIFWNAAMTGTRTFYGMLNPRYGTYGLKALSALMAIAFYTAWGGEEDEDGKNKESRMKNLGNAINIFGFDIGLAQELRPAYHLAQSIAFYLDGTWDMSKAMGHVVSGLSQAVVPVSPASTGDAQVDLLYALTPTILQPLVLQGAGKTFFGGDNAPVPYDEDGNQWTDAPDYLRAQSKSSTFAKSTAKMLHDITGGSIDVAPGSIDMWGQQVFGSAFSMAKDVAHRVNQGESYPEAVYNQFAKSHNHEYNEFALKEEFQDRLKSAMEKNRIGEDGQILGKSNFTDKYLELQQIEKAVKTELKQYVSDDGSKITDLYRQLENVKRSDSYSPDEFYRLTTQIDAIRRARNEVYGKYNRILMEMGY